MLLYKYSLVNNVFKINKGGEELVDVPASLFYRLKIWKSDDEKEDAAWIYTRREHDADEMQKFLKNSLETLGPGNWIVDSETLEINWDLPHEMWRRIPGAKGWVQDKPEV